MLPAVFNAFSISPVPSVGLSLRCAAARTWLAAMIAPGDAAAAQSFQAASSAYAAALPPGHVGRLDLQLLAGELAAAAGRSPEPALTRARQAWRATMGIDPPARVIFLH